MRRTRIVELDEGRDIICPICKTVIIGDEGLTQQPSCPHVSFVYANGGCFEYDPEGLQKRLDAAQEKANEEGDYFDAWDWLSAHCDKRDVFLERSSESVACGQVSFKVRIGIRTESDYGTDKDEFSSKDHRIFFQPTPKFVQWMKAHHGNKHIYDVGAGMGNVSNMLAKAGLRVTAIDLEPRSVSEFDVIKADSTEYPFEKGSVLMFCRPCHDHDFVRNTILCQDMMAISSLCLDGQSVRDICV
jgi:hypothetical protein